MPDLKKSLSEIRAEAGRKGGRATLKKHGRDHYRRIGRKGAESTWQRYSLRPYKTSQFAMVDRESGEIKAIRSA